MHLTLKTLTELEGTNIKVGGCRKRYHAAAQCKLQNHSPTLEDVESSNAFTFLYRIGWQRRRAQKFKPQELQFLRQFLHCNPLSEGDPYPMQLEWKMVTTNALSA
jgi:hypothetical protein